MAIAVATDPAQRGHGVPALCRILKPWLKFLSSRISKLSLVVGLANDSFGFQGEQTISAKPVGVGAASQPWIPTGERSSLLTHIATTERVSLCVQMKSWLRFLN